VTRVGLVLGAGGVTGGAFHAGVLAALHEVLGWDARRAEIIVGTSAGSLTGAVLRAGLPPGDLAARAEGTPLSAEGRRVLARAAPPPSSFPLRPSLASAARAGRGRSAAPELLAAWARRPWTMRPGALAAGLLPPGTVSTDMITGGIGPLFGARWPSDALWVCAVRLSDGRRVVFGRDAGVRHPPVGSAVAASCAIPSFFEPVEIDGHRYVDGGVHSPTNLDLLRGLDLDLVVVSSPMSIAGRGLTGRVSADTALRRACRAFLDREAISVRRRGTPVVAFQPTPDDASVMGINAMDPSRRAEVARRIRASTARRLERPGMRDRLAALVG
jgi:NTE family protein